MPPHPHPAAATGDRGPTRVPGCSAVLSDHIAAWGMGDRDGRVCGRPTLVLCTSALWRGGLLAAACVLGRLFPAPCLPNTTLSSSASHTFPSHRRLPWGEGCWWPPPHTSTGFLCSPDSPEGLHFPPTETDLRSPSRSLWRSLSEQLKTFPFDVIYCSQEATPPPPSWIVLISAGL